jgi:hypothetical protein
MPRLAEFEDELTMRSVNGIAGDWEYDPTRDLEGTLDPWADDRWTIARRKAELDQHERDPLEDATRSQFDDPREKRPEGAEGPRGVDLKAIGGDFDLGGWMGSVTNGRIPQRLLAPVGNTGLFMEAHAAAAMEAMIAAAKADGVSLTIGNSYRTFAKQVEMRANYEAGRGALAADPGTSNHGWGLAVDFNITPENHAWLAANAGRFGYSNPFGNGYDAQENWHWEYGQSGDSPSFTDPTVKWEPKRKKRAKPEPVEGDAAGAAARLVDPEQNPLANAVYAVYGAGPGAEPELMARQQSFKGPGGGVKAQLYQGFMDAGRPDLAAMVSTPEFQKWIAQESGWRPDAVSQANNHGLANDGLFQVWRGHKFNANGQVSSMSPYDQAQIVAKYFHLTPADIRRYAQQITAGEYAGWG